jgi:predicted GNAT family acetyltransferase
VDLNLDSVRVTNDEDAGRFEAAVDGFRALLTYRRSPGRITFLHAEVPPPLQRQGLAAKLTRTALEFARANHLQVVPLCPYVAGFIRKHREYQDLVSADHLQKILTR